MNAQLNDEIAPTPVDPVPVSRVVRATERFFVIRGAS
jgi:hypothetical protein